MPAEQAGAEESTRALDENFDPRRRNEELRFDLQSTEENLQSAIEELYTVSAEHQRKIEELMHLSLDMEHLLKSTEIGAIFLDEKMYVRRVTPAAARTFNLIPRDVGRPTTHFTFRFEGVDFLGLLSEVHCDRVVREAQVKVDGRAYLMRILAMFASMDARPQRAAPACSDRTRAMVARLFCECACGVRQWPRSASVRIRAYRSRQSADAFVPRGGGGSPRNPRIHRRGGQLVGRSLQHGQLLF